ncbi:MAG TPA: YceI family protein [Leptospiraceae bacterium]|nr:YceI family protein [Leptospiraceae bacterium]HMW04458.1 YceI family protein [Leptospiraceae bacterium]HMX31116.1 YceI family protein [Leptospiraceae bacterium]HMY30644.1 YceI family protein [Leptospiraceae bacterium]HMZ65823.1 YceI family protein [Leptospiraceae bacterium]
MMRLILFICLFYSYVNAVEIKESQLTVTSGKITFLSEAPQETIKGIGKQISGEILFKEKKVKIIIDLTDWKTNNKLQTSHLHENYLETEKFPKAEFDGIIQSYDSKTGDVSVIGSIQLHGVTKKDVSIKGKVTSGEGGYSLVSSFSINLKDYSIEVPKLLILKVSETVNLEVKLELKPIKN